MGGFVSPERDFFFARHITIDPETLEAPLRPAHAGAGQYYDVSDYLDACAGGRGLTGIQRVQECIVRELLDGTAGPAFVMVDRVYGRTWSIDHAGLRTLAGDKTQKLISHQAEVQRRRAEALLDKSVLVSLGPGDLLINLGCFWGDQYQGDFARHHQAAGFGYVPLLYDLIPIDSPELCEGRTVQKFSDSLPVTLRQSHAVLTISQWTQRRLHTFTSAHGITPPPVHVVTLAHQLDPRISPGMASAAPALPAFGNGFVLCVGTIEPRKNQLRLAEAWARLAADIARMPALVIVGRLGWLAPPDLERLTALCGSTGKIVLIHDVSDERLATLYAQCLFTVFLSLDEGWGLPVGESLAFGKICLASNAGAIPEAGGSLAIYVDPLDTTAIVAALRTLITDAPARRAREARITRDLRLRTWLDVTVDLLGAVREAAARPHRR